MASRITTLIVEDDADTRESLSRTVSEQPELLLCGAAEDCLSARALFAAHRPQIVLMDLGLPDGRGSDLIRVFSQQDPAALFLVLTSLGDEASVIEAVEAGACSYLLKDASANQIARSIREVLAGGSPISPAVARYLLKRMHKPAAAATAPTGSTVALSERENEVLQLVAKGYAYSEIGRSLSISVNTVGSYIRQIYFKLGVRSRGEAVFEALQQGLIDAPIKRRE